MIGELAMHLRHFNLRHVAGHTLFSAYRASRRPTIDRLSCARRGEVAGQAFRVIEGWLTLHPIMRIMTCQATDPTIAFVSGTIKNSIRLEANVVDAPLPWQKHYVVKAAMTGATEFLRESV